MFIFFYPVDFFIRKNQTKFGVYRKRIHYEAFKKVLGQLSNQKISARNVCIPGFSFAVVARTATLDVSPLPRG